MHTDMTVSVPEDPQVTDLAQLPTPGDSEAPLVPADMMKLAEALDPRLNLYAKDESDRNARYQDAPAGTLVSTPDGWQWLKTDDPGSPWAVLRSVETLTADGFTWANMDGYSFEDASDNSSIVRIGPHYDLFLSAVYHGPDKAADSDGFLTDMRIATLPSGWRPRISRLPVVAGPAHWTGVGAIYGSTGTINITSAWPGTTLSEGMTVVITDSWTAV